MGWGLQMSLLQPRSGNLGRSFKAGILVKWRAFALRSRRLKLSIPVCKRRRFLQARAAACELTHHFISQDPDPVYFDFHDVAWLQGAGGARRAGVDDITWIQSHILTGEADNGCCIEEQIAEHL